MNHLLNGTFPHLPRPIDVEWPDGDGGQAVMSAVRVSHVLAGQLAQSVGPPLLTGWAYGQAVGLRASIHEGAVHLARREFNEPTDLVGDRRFECIEGAEQVHVQRA